MLPFLQKPFRLDQFKQRLSLLTSIAPASLGEAALESALRNNQLELWYQPKIGLKSRQVCGAEGRSSVCAIRRVGFYCRRSFFRDQVTRCIIHSPIS
jgi:hypothetical protein